MYAMVCHSGALGGGHYVSYSKTEAGTWFCHNDSACKEVPETSIDKSTAYILLYEREGLSLSGGLTPTPPPPRCSISRPCDTCTLHNT